MVSWWATQFTSALLFELEPRDVPTMAGAALLLTAVAGLSAWLPARIDPASVLRES